MCWALFLLLLLSSNSVCSDGGQIPLEVLRVWPIESMTLSPGQKQLSIGFNQPIQEAEYGQLKIVNMVTLETVFQSVIHSPYITVSSATVNVNLPFALESTQDGQTTFMVTLDEASYVSVAGASSSPIVSWSFLVSSGAVFYNSSIPADLSFEAIITPLLSLIDPDNLASTIKTLSSPELFGTRFFQSQSGKHAVDWLTLQYWKLIETYPRSRQPQIEHFNHTWLMPSLIVRLPGVAKDAPVVILGWKLILVLNSILISSLFFSVPGAHLD